MWLGETPTPTDPSPKLQAYVSVSLFGSLEPDPSSTTAVPIFPAYGPPTLLTGGSFAAVTTACVEAVELSPTPFDTVSPIA